MFRHSVKKKTNTMDKISESRNTALTMELYDNLRVKNAFKSVYYIIEYTIRKFLVLKNNRFCNKLLNTSCFICWWTGIAQSV
jgi:hypothetical protein